MDNYGYIYETINKENGMIYVGKKRGTFNDKYHGTGLHIVRAINKYGENRFITCLIDSAKTNIELNKKEKAYIFAYRSVIGQDRLYNISDGGDGGDLLSKHPNKRSIRQKIIKSRKLIAKKRGYWHSDETLQKIRSPRSEEAKQHMREAERSPQTKEHILKRTQSRIRSGKSKRSDKTKQKMRYAALGRKCIYNLELNKTKHIKENQIQKYLNDGWIYIKDARRLFPL